MLREFGFGVLRDPVVFDLFMLVLFVAFCVGLGLVFGVWFAGLFGVFACLSVYFVLLCAGWLVTCLVI